MNKEILRMQMLAGIITESQYKKRLNENIDSFEDYIQGMWDSSVPEETEGYFEGIWEKDEYADSEVYDDADEFLKLSQYLKSVGGEATLEGNPDITLKLLPNGDIKFNADNVGSLDENLLNENQDISTPGEYKISVPSVGNFSLDVKSLNIAQKVSSATLTTPEGREIDFEIFMDKPTISFDGLEINEDDDKYDGWTEDETPKSIKDLVLALKGDISYDDDPYHDEYGLFTVTLDKSKLEKYSTYIDED
jgi:hypothetical protein